MARTIQKLMPKPKSSQASNGNTNINPTTLAVAVAALLFSERLREERKTSDAGVSNLAKKLAHIVHKKFTDSGTECLLIRAKKTRTKEHIDKVQDELATQFAEDESYAAQLQDLVDKLEAAGVIFLVNADSESRLRLSKWIHVVGILRKRPVISVIIVILALLITKDILRNPMVIKPFAVPSDLEKEGYSGETIARMLADQMYIIQDDVQKFVVQDEWEGNLQSPVGKGERQREEPSRRRKARPKTIQIESTEEKKLHDIALPGTGMSLRALIDLVRRFIPLEPPLIISGYVTSAEKKLSLTLGINKLRRTFYGKLDDLNRIIKDAAFYVMSISEPLDMGLYFCFTSDTKRLKSLIETHQERTSSDKDRATRLILEGCILGIEKETTLALGKIETALKVPLEPTKSIHSFEAHKSILFFSHWVAGTIHQHAEQYKDAIDQFDKALSEEPENLEMHIKLANTYYAQGNIDQADYMFEKAIELEENDAWIYLAWGYALWDRREYQKGIEKFEQVIKRMPDLEIIALANLGWGELLRAQRKYEEAIEKLKGAINLASDEITASVYGAWGDILINQRKPEEAVAKYEKAAELTPKEAWPFGAWGDALRVLKKSEEAISKYERAAVLAPHEAWPYGALGDALRDLRKVEEAIEYYKKAILLAPYKAWLYGALGNALRDLKKPDEAILQYKKAIRLAPKEAWPFAAWGDALRDQKKLKEAVAKYEKAIAMAPYEAWLYGSLGNALRDLKKPDKAILLYKKAIQLAPKEAWPFGTWGNALRDQKKYKEAVAKYKKAISMTPNEAWLYGALGDALREQNEPVKAISKYRKAIELAPNEPWPYRSLCLTGSLLREATDVMSACNRAVALNPDDARNHDSRGLARALTGDYSGAIEDFKFVVDYAKSNDDEELYPNRKFWITELEEARNPFDDVSLQSTAFKGSWKRH